MSCQPGTASQGSRQRWASWLPSATAVTLSLAEPVTAFALAVAVVGERPGGTAFAGLAAVLAGLAIVVRTEVRPDRP